jgi:hypothetical protein
MAREKDAKARYGIFRWFPPLNKSFTFARQQKKTEMFKTLT